MIVTIHQPDHMPWLGFFHKVNKADVYVILDNVKYRKLYFHNRNRIRTASGEQWISIPVAKHNDSTLINEIRLSADNQKQREKNARIIQQSYQKAPFFDSYWPEFREVYLGSWESLCKLNVELLLLLFRYIGIQKKIVWASDLDICGVKSELNLSICKAVGAKHYLSGISGKEYLDLDSFGKSGIQVGFQEFHHPIYMQMYEPFLPCMSALDLLFNYGEQSLDTINGIGVPVMEKLFE